MIIFILLNILLSYGRNNFVITLKLSACVEYINTDDKIINGHNHKLIIQGF